MAGLFLPSGVLLCVFTNKFSLSCRLTASACSLSTSVFCSDLPTSLERNLYATLSAVVLLCSFLCKDDDPGTHSGSPLLLRDNSFTPSSLLFKSSCTSTSAAGGGIASSGAPFFI